MLKALQIWKKIILIVKIIEIIYDMFYYFGKNLRYICTLYVIFGNCNFTIHLISYCDSVKMVDPSLKFKYYPHSNNACVIRVLLE